jgi:DNA-directed RNA polymerase subunit M/transcription elongation factor TFIIS
LEHTIAELNETNAFYAAVVSQQDKTEHAQQAKIDELENDIKRLKAELAACPKCQELRLANDELQGRCSDQDHEIREYNRDLQ